MPHVYVTGHKNPDTDTIASAIGYAEYKNLVDPENHYVAARLGEVNAQTAWALKRSGAQQPQLLEHIMLRVKDVMAGDVAVARKNDPLRNVGLTMAKRNISQLPIVEDDGSHRDHHGAQPGAHVRAGVARGFHFRREPCLGRGDGRGARRRASGRGGRLGMLGPVVGHLDERGLDGAVHEAW